MEQEPWQGDPGHEWDGGGPSLHPAMEGGAELESPVPPVGCVVACVSSTPGLLWQLRPSDVEVELLAHTRDVVSRELPAETGLHTGWVENGGLFIASNKQRLDEYKRLMSVG